MAHHHILNHEAVLDDYHSKLKECTTIAVCGREFVFVEKLKEWMKGRVGRLIHAAYGGRRDFFLPQPETIYAAHNAHNCCLIVFAVLLYINEGRLIDSFQRFITDIRLPTTLETIEGILKHMDCPPPNTEKLAQDFYRAQWRFCPVKFELNIGRNYHDENLIIPICHKREINKKGHTAHLSMITVPEEFVGHDLREVVEESRFEDKNDDLGFRYLFALKTFQEANKKYYDNERKAFEGLRGNPGMVRFLADYTHNEGAQHSNKARKAKRQQTDGRNVTYNILLEFGDGDLDECFIYNQPPVLENEIEEFWKELFEVADAVDGVHNLKIIIEDNDIQEFHGWHADIKPDNILKVQNKFKLADPGFAKFIKKTDGIPEEHVSGGTETYGSPERHLEKLDTSILVSQAIDVWSLGCVFSVAATWLVLGYKGVREFSKLRERAIKDIINEHKNRRSSQGSEKEPPTTQGDWFHDGTNVLQDVISWHNFLRNSARRSDSITSQVLDLVDKKMLVGKPEDRMAADEICRKLKEIKTQPQIQPTESIMKVLLEVDEAAISEPDSTAISRTSFAPNPSLTISEDRKLRKSKALNMPFTKTPHRASVLRSTLEGPKAQPVISEILSHSPTIMERPISHDSGVGISPPPLNKDPPPKHQRNIQSLNSQSIISQRVLADPFASSHSLPQKWEIPPQNVYQAREQMEEGNKWYTFPRLRKDPLLSQYFRNRDIKFLVDNAETMREFWYEATYLLETLVMKTRGQDKNGMDLSFTNGPIAFQNEKGESAFVKAMKDPKAQPAPGMKTDMKRELGDILSRHLNEVKARRYSQNSLKNLTIIVLTDGLWEGMSEEDGVDQKILSFATSLKSAIGDLVERPVSIEFIQFGRDPAATLRLQRLDDKLIPDIVDTEPSSGDINKMILGSFVDWWDKLDKEETIVPGSPGQGGNSYEPLFGSPTSQSPPFSLSGTSPSQMFQYPTSPATFAQPGRKHTRTDTRISIPPIAEDPSTSTHQ